MKLKKLPFLMMAGSMLFFLSSCIQEEPLNAECDILGVDSIWLSRHKDMIIGNPMITNTTVSFNVKKGTDCSKLDPSFYLTPGARLTMEKDGMSIDANGAVRDFTLPQTYTAHSEDGAWSKKYMVSFNYPRPATDCHFEYFELEKKGRYYIWYENDSSDPANPRRDYWASGNAGFAFTGKGKTPADYPTCVCDDGYKGKGVVLTTRNTGSFGALAKMPIAAGNLFIGEFKSEKATIDPMGATRFGLQIVGGKPLYLSGYYKYKAGEVFTDKKGAVDPSRRDTCDIYAVLYEVNPDKFVPLQGNDVLSSERIVSLARLEQPGEPKEWTRFDIPFVYQNNKTFDKERFRNNGYAITIVATSSRQGAYFEGAVDSQLYVDEIKLTWEEVN